MTCIVSFEAFELGLAAGLPRLVQFRAATSQLQLDGAHLVNVLISHFHGSVGLLQKRDLNLRANEVLPNRILELVQLVVHQLCLPRRVDDRLHPGIIRRLA